MSTNPKGNQEKESRKLAEQKEDQKVRRRCMGGVTEKKEPVRKKIESYDPFTDKWLVYE